MIHIDHHTSPAQFTSHKDHSVLSWSPEGQQFPHEFPDTIQPHSQPHPLPSSKPSSRVGPKTPTDAALTHNSRPSSPPSPADGNSTSPTRERSSSLSPLPESRPHSPTRANATKGASMHNEDEETQTSRKGEEEEGQGTAQESLRALTPLSELSEPPDDGDYEEFKEEEFSSKASSPEVSDKKGAKKKGKRGRPAGKKNKPKGKTPSTRSKTSATPTRESTEPASSARAPSREAINHTASHRFPPTPSNSNLVDATRSSQDAGSSKGKQMDDKVVVMLEINAELFKILSAVQSRGPALMDPQVQPYADRLQKNLAWLAAAYDQNRIPVDHAPPDLTPLPPLEYSRTERLQKLYGLLSKSFARDAIPTPFNPASHMGAHFPPSASDPSLVPIGMKREREDGTIDMSIKRRNTGSDLGVPTMHSPMPPPIMPVSQVNPIDIASNPAAINMHMPPPGPNPLAEMRSMSQTPNSMEAAKREQAQRLLQQQMQQQQQLKVQPAPSAPSQAGGAPGQLPPHVQQALNIARDPNHQVTQFLNRSIPNFGALPMQTQVQQVIKAVNSLRQQHQQQQQQQAQQAQQQQQQQHQQQSQQQQQAHQMLNAGLGGLPQNPSTPNISATMGGAAGGIPSFPPQGMTSPTISNPGLTSPVVNTPMQPQNTMFSPTGPGMGMDARGMQGMPQGMPPNMTPQQRQLLLMQSQRGGVGPSNLAGMNPTGMNPGMMMNSPQTPFQSQGNQPKPNEPFTPIRSSSTVPGISRSTRSPSEAAPSPSAMPSRDSMPPPSRTNVGTPQNVPTVNTFNPLWQQQQQAGMQQMMGGPGTMGGYSGFNSPMSPPSANSLYGNIQQSNQAWSPTQQSPGAGLGGQFPNPFGGMTVENIAASRHTSATPAPGMQPTPSQMSPMNMGMGFGQDPTGMGSSGNSEYDIFNWS